MAARSRKPVARRERGFDILPPVLLVFALFGSGVAAGILGALLGLGGGIFLVPVLTLLFGLPVRLAVGTSLLGVIATSAGVAVVSSDEGGADVPLALRLEMATTIGAVAGGFASSLVSSRALSLLFAGVVFGTAAYTFYKGGHKGESAENPPRARYTVRNWPLGTAVAALAGMVSGLLGVGGGFIKVPTMYAIMGLPLGVATATSNFMVGITAAASIFVYFGRGDIHPPIAVPVGLGVLVGAVFGTLLQPHIKVTWLRRGLIALLLLVGVQMVVKGF